MTRSACPWRLRALARPCGLAVLCLCTGLLAVTYPALSQHVGPRGGFTRHKAPAPDVACCGACPDWHAPVLTLQACHYKLTPGQTQLLPIWIIRRAEIRPLDWTVEYDASVAVLHGDARPGNLAGDGSPFESDLQAPGLARLILSGPQGMQGNGTVALLPFQAVGPVGSRTPLKLVVRQIDTVRGAQVRPRVTDGSISVVAPSGQVAGDCDGDGVLTALDARCALRMAAQLTPERSNLDVDRDGRVTARDAVLILRQAVTLARRRP